MPHKPGHKVEYKGTMTPMQKPGKPSIYKGTDKSTDKAKPVTVKKSDTKPKVYGNSNVPPKRNLRAKGY